jgi:hypothetical protein
MARAAQRFHASLCPKQGPPGKIAGIAIQGDEFVLVLVMVELSLHHVCHTNSPLKVITCCIHPAPHLAGIYICGRKLHCS